MPYIVAEFPITLTIKKFGPNYVLPALVASWGLVCCMQGFVHNYSGLLAARFFLGLAEGGVLPGLVTYMSMCGAFTFCACRRVTLLILSPGDQVLDQTKDAAATVCRVHCK